MKYNYHGYASLPYLLRLGCGPWSGTAAYLLIYRALKHAAKGWRIVAALLVALIIGFLALVAFQSAVFYITKRFIAFPVCRNGVCRSYPDDYTWLTMTMSGWVEIGRSHYRCNCNDEYLRLGKRFFYLAPDCTLVRYKKYIGRGRWIDDTDPDIKHECVYYVSDEIEPDAT